MPALLTERQGHLLIITLNRPERQNAINGEMLVRLYDACVEADENPDIRCIVLTGAGGNFCSGADLKEMAGGHQGNADDEIDVMGRLGADPDLPWKALLRTWRPNVPIILAAEGTAIAGGTELLGATEIRVAGESAKFGISEVRWSLYPMGGSAVRIPRQIPYTIACELLLTGDHITAQRALELGLIGHVVPDGEALAKAIEIGNRICENG
ncbi:MAG: enoyl-CoA hydratase-related protein, partial [Actinomycetes bacterium]